MKNRTEQDNEKNGVKIRLMEAGIHLFSEKGYAGTSVREIVSQAGVTKPALYYYFENKAGLFRAILDWAEYQQEIILDEVLSESGSVLEKILLLCRRFYHRMLENKNLSALLHNLIFTPPQGLPKHDLAGFHYRLVDAIKTIYQEGVVTGEVVETELEEVALVVLSLIVSSFNLEYALPELADPERPERMLRLVFRGLAADPLAFSKGQ